METLWSYLSSKRWFSLSTRRLLPICKGKGSSLTDVTLSRSSSMSIANPMPWRVKHHSLIWAEEPPCTLMTWKRRVVQLQRLPFFLITGKIRHFFSMVRLYCNNLLINSASSIKKKNKKKPTRAEAHSFPLKLRYHDLQQKAQSYVWVRSAERFQRDFVHSVLHHMKYGPDMPRFSCNSFAANLPPFWATRKQLVRVMLV